MITKREMVKLVKSLRGKGRKKTSYPEVARKIGVSTFTIYSLINPDYSRKPDIETRAKFETFLNNQKIANENARELCHAS
jgi:hypothetical protein